MNTTNTPEDEIDLAELFSTIWKNKFKIILLSVIITVFSIIYALSKPNIYSSSTILSSTTPSKGMSLGGLGGLASLAGINVGSKGGGLDAYNYLTIILKDYDFNQKIIEKYNITKLLESKQENLVFAANISSIYNFLQNEEKVSNRTIEDINYATFQIIQNIISISKDKKSSLITMKVEHKDRFLTKKLVEIYLNEITSYIRKSESKDIEKQLEYYNKELESTTDISLKEQLNKLVSSLVQKKVLSNSSKYYIVKQIQKPRVSYIKEKTKPKRALIVIVSFITSIILGIFLVFFLEFVKNSKNKEI